MDAVKGLSSHFRVIFKIDGACKEGFWEQSNTFIGIYSPFKVLSSTKKVSYCVTFAGKVN
jgi:hypothetical protein